MYEVVVSFTDKDDNHEYLVGDSFPHDGRKVSKSRLNELIGKKNAMGEPLIEKVDAASAQEEEDEDKTTPDSTAGADTGNQQEDTVA